MGYKVQDEYRTNDLSLRPGGVIICVQQLDGRVLEYDKVKNPFGYIRTLRKGGSKIKKWWVKDE